MKVNLYWCTTPCESENWFVFAKTKKQASQWFEDEEGFDTSYADAEFICEVPNFPDKPEERDRSEFPDWAQIPDLVKLGFKIVQEDEPRKVEYNGQIYEEGDLTYEAQRLNNIIHGQNPELN
ncbi:MAG: hypothetical protein U9Q83_06480 [Bacteroidota bacterium]|nr:hypothetical protein [Bacteroidota bacterium]